jgi:hypothetical protein
VAELNASEAAVAVIEAVLAEQDLPVQRPSVREFVVELPGEARLTTSCWLTVGEHALRIEAFVIRRPEENHEQVWAYLLRQNARMYAVSWSIDDAGDIYLSGRVALAAVTPDEVDRILGSVLEYSDGTFNVLLRLGFASSIRREWAWREKNGESLANLAAFADFARTPPPEDRAT